MWPLDMSNNLSCMCKRVFGILAVALFLSPVPSVGAQATDELAGKPKLESVTVQPAHYWLRVTGERVNVRSRADVNSRLVGRVDRDDALEAVGEEYGWHRIVPPAGVYSLVSTPYIDQLSDDRGIVNVDTTLRIRVGSDVQPRDPMLSEVQARLERGAEVRILGQLDAQWLKIVPPEGVYVYVSGDFVEHVSAEVAARLKAAKPTPAPTSAPAVATSQPVEPPGLAGPWGRKFSEVSDAIKAEQAKSIENQEWTAIIEQLTPIAKQREEPRVAELATGWTGRIERRMTERDALLKARGIAERGEAKAAEHEEKLEDIEAERKTAKPERGFHARGVLRPSFALVAGPYGMRYKLQDPFTRRVEAYVEFPPQLGIDVRACVGKYVGIRGTKQTVAGVKVTVLRVNHLTVLNPERPQESPPAKKP